MKKKEIGFSYAFFLISFVFAFLITTPGLAQNIEAEFYIAPNGNDSWSGKLSEPNFDNNDGPLATLDEARIRLQEYISDGLSGPLTVLIRGGEYRLDSTIIFGPEDSGTREYPVYYRAYPNETPVFTGKKKLDDWQRCEQSPEGLPEVSVGKIYFADIPEGLKGKWHITSLYNGKKLFHHIRIQETGEFKDRSFWGGGNGWCAAGMAQVIDFLPEERKADKQKLITYCAELLDGCIENQLPDGLLYDKITEPNFEETTLPAMLAYTIYTGVNSGWLDSSYLHAAKKMRKAVYANVDEFGLLQNASNAPRFNSPGTSTEGQAFFLMMEGAFRKLANDRN